MTKSKAYYQAYLVIGCLSKEEYSLIPKDLLKEIEMKMEVDESIKVDKTIPLEKQKIDEKTYDILDRVIRAIEKAYGKDAIDNPSKYAEQAQSKSKDDSFEIEIDDVMIAPRKEKPADKKPITSSNKEKVDNRSEKDLREENIKLNGIIEALEAEKKKLDEAKELYYNYKEVVNKKDEIIRMLQIENDNLKQNNEELKNMLNSIPSLFRKLFRIDKLLK